MSRMENSVSQVTAIQPERRKRGRPKGSKNKPKKGTRKKPMKVLAAFSSPEPQPQAQPEILPPEPSQQSAVSSGENSSPAQPDDFDKAAAHVIAENGAGATAGAVAGEQPPQQIAGEILRSPEYFRRKAEAIIPKPFRMMAVA